MSVHVFRLGAGKCKHKQRKRVKIDHVRLLSHVVAQHDETTDPAYHLSYDAVWGETCAPHLSPVKRHSYTIGFLLMLTTGSSTMGNIILMDNFNDGAYSDFIGIRNGIRDPLKWVEK